MTAPQKYRQRYIAFENKDKLPEKKIKKIISTIGRKLNLSPPPWLVVYRDKTGEGLVKCGQLQVGKVKVMIKKQKNSKFQVLGVSGTIKKSRQKFLNK